MVLDDYQFARDIRLNKLILQLAQEEPDGLHILLVTRDTTDIDFVGLLSKGICCILSKQHLKFTESEIQDYCRTMLDGKEMLPDARATVVEGTNKDLPYQPILKLEGTTDGEK